MRYVQIVVLIALAPSSYTLPELLPSPASKSVSGEEVFNESSRKVVIDAKQNGMIAQDCKKQRQETRRRARARVIESDRDREERVVERKNNRDQNRPKWI